MKTRIRGVLTDVASGDPFIYIDGVAYLLVGQDGRGAQRKTMHELQKKVGREVTAEVTLGRARRVERRDIKLLPKAKKNPNFSVMHADGSLTPFWNPRKPNPNFSIMHADGALTPFWNPRRNPGLSDYLAAGKRAAAKALADTAKSAQATVADIQAAAAKEATKVRESKITPKQALELLAAQYGLHVNPRRAPLRWAYSARNTCWLARTQKAAFEIVEDRGFRTWKGSWSKRADSFRRGTALGTYPTLELAKLAAEAAR